MVLNDQMRGYQTVLRSVYLQKKEKKTRKHRKNGYMRLSRNGMESKQIWRWAIGGVGRKKKLDHSQKTPMGGGGGVRGILLDSSAILSSDTLHTGADYLLRKLRYSNIPTGLLYAVDLTEAKVVSLLEKLAHEYSLERFVYNPSCMDDTVNAVSLAWKNNGATILHVVSNDNEGLVPKSLNSDWINVVVNVDGDGTSKNLSGIVIEKLEELPLTICELNRKCSEDNVVVGYIMKPSREEDFAKRGAFPLNPTENGLIFLPLTFDLPMLYQLKKVDIVIHKATDEISSIERSNSCDHSGNIIYTTRMLELQRYIGELPDCCVIDPFDNIFPVVDRLKVQEILLGLANLKTESRHKIRGAYFLQVDNFEDVQFEQRLHEAKLSLPSIVKPQVACGVAEAHSMAIVFKAVDFLGLSVPLPAVVQEYVDHSSTLFKMYVLGEKVFYAVKNSTPNADILKNSSEKNGSKPLLFDSLKSLPIDGSKMKEQPDLDIELVTGAATYLRRVLDLTIFGFDVVIQEGTRDHVIVDVNYLPSFKEVPNEIVIPAFWDAIRMKYRLRKGVRV
ncbi:inositol 1,3,4-trisphosphate 5/6-kinase 4 isoform X3 [Helianthus annuus]|uniref:inositol 1,3,4-trisphosphate 5/6-kinase 4 isoform X3 n=1 Tax=Helianthus annuus TaxID=4232 RepID=UPI000B9085EB|nr:inositol 1,3,4-trisphosphate 5/6-kinase 4 isoform X3 [Helianthus annuus]